MPNAIDTLREMISQKRGKVLVLTNGFPQERRDYYLADMVRSEGALADVEALLQAAEDRYASGHNDWCDSQRGLSNGPFPCTCDHDALAAAVRRVKGEPADV